MFMIDEKPLGSRGSAASTIAWSRALWSSQGSWTSEYCITRSERAKYKMKYRFDNDIRVLA